MIHLRFYFSRGEKYGLVEIHSRDNSEEKKLQLDEIYCWLEKNYSYYKGNKTNWKVICLTFICHLPQYQFILELNTAQPLPPPVF